ncbi:phage tail protein [Helicobacter winghamensis]|mgnify:CR=1 FL=1|uniref:phage tail protein n=1 Tax=Helicobacter winghamensis TaxID=157268 RepID=UPI00242A660D|nr:phage tail protein [Helicobacter winghamensis]
MAKSDFYTILTEVGIAKFIAARASGNGVNLEKFKLSSEVILPTESMRSLSGIVYEANIAAKSIDENNPNYVNLECYVPSDVGGFEVNAIGIYDSFGDLIAIGNTPRTYKPLLGQGSAKELMIKVVMELSNAQEVILKLEPSVIMASRDFVNKIKLELDLKIDQAILDFTTKLALKADLNGNSSEKFSVANPTEASHAINKGEFDKALNNLNSSLGGCMKLTGNQSASGNKTFTGVTTLNGNLNANGAVAFKNLPTCATQASNDNQLINLATLKKQAPSLAGGLGIGQSWKNALSSIKENITYTNNTGKPILFIVQDLEYIPKTGGRFTWGFIVDNIVFGTGERYYDNAQLYKHIKLSCVVVVRNGGTYQIKLTDQSSSITRKGNIYLLS